MTTKGELLTAIKYPLPETAGKCHLFIFFHEIQKTTFFAFLKPVISFFDDVSQKILYLLNCLPIGRQQKREYKRTC